MESTHSNWPVFVASSIEHILAVVDAGEYDGHAQVHEHPALVAAERAQLLQQSVDVYLLT